MLLALVAIFVTALPGEAAANPRYASIVIEADTGRVLSERYADKRLYPASLTKMMTLYLAFEAIRDGRIRSSTRIPVSSNAARQEPSSLALQAGSTISVKDAILALVTKSANDVAVALGEALGGGSEKRFVEMMNAKARALGMKDTRFANPSGLYDPAQVSTARDMARMGQALLRDFPRDYKYFSTPSFTWAGKSMRNHNRLLTTYEGMDGIKTGYVSKSGFNLVASAVRGDRRLIGVVFGGRTATTRNAHMVEILDRGFQIARQPRLAAATTSQKPPQFDAMGLVMKDEQGVAVTDQGDADLAVQFPDDFRPRPISVQTLGAYRARAYSGLGGGTGGDWAIQVGSFNSKSSSLRVLRTAQSRLGIAGHARAATPMIVPLSTNRGTIYRARLTGLAKAEAENACRLLRENCLVLAME